MSDDVTQCSVGRVETHVTRIPLPPEGLRLASGGVLQELDVAYEAYGRLSPAGENVIFICHALSGDAHVAGYHDPENPATCGWWDQMVGPGKGIDTDFYHVICANVLGGCKGTTGPSSLDPRTGKAYGSTFPAITVSDIVDVHRLLLAQLGIQKLAAVIGGSFGGMQVLDWAIRHPDMIDRAVCIASAASLSTQALSFDVVGRQAVTSDPDWQGGDYYDSGRIPAHGLSQARKIGHITYLSQEMMTRKFGRGRREREPQAAGTEAEGSTFSSNFEVESYLDHQGRKFIDRFDANSYLQITRAMDEFDLGEAYGSLEAAFAPVKAKSLVVALSKDWLFPPRQSIEIAHALLRAGRDVSYCRLHAPHGHDAFLVDIEHLTEVIRAFLPWVKSRPTSDPETERTEDNANHPPPPHGGKRREYEVIVQLIEPNSRVLDLGCGSGELLTRLKQSRNVRGIGVDIDIRNVITVLDKGHDVFQADIDDGMAMIPDRTYDYAVLGETLQVIRKPRLVLDEMLRVAREGVVSFPNFGNWVHRMQLCLSGRMPKGGALPFEWYETPNIHLCTLKDFADLCRREGIQVQEIMCIPERWLDRILVTMRLCNIGAHRVLVKLARCGDMPMTTGCTRCGRPFDRADSKKGATTGAPAP